MTSGWRSKTGCSHGQRSERSFDVVHLLNEVSANGDDEQSDCDSKASHQVDEAERPDSTCTLEYHSWRLGRGYQSHCEAPQSVWTPLHTCGSGSRLGVLVAESLPKAGGCYSKYKGIEGDWYLGKGNSNGRMEEIEDGHLAMFYMSAYQLLTYTEVSYSNCYEHKIKLFMPLLVST